MGHLLTGFTGSMSWPSRKGSIRWPPRPTHGSSHKILSVPHRMQSLGLRAAATRLVRAQAKGQKEGKFITNDQPNYSRRILGCDAQKKALPNGTLVLNFSLV